VPKEYEKVPRYDYEKGEKGEKGGLTGSQPH